MRNEGLRKVAFVGYWSRIVAIDVLLRFNFVLFFPLMYIFSFPPSKEKLIGDDPMNRQHAAFPLSVSPCVNILTQRCTSRQ